VLNVYFLFFLFFLQYFNYVLVVRYIDRTKLFSWRKPQSRDAYIDVNITNM